MSAVGRTTWAGFGWLTAVMTLVASLPHFQCQCPNGSVKPFCFGVFCSSSGCCCGDVCSGGPKDSQCNSKATPARKGRAPCCCAHPISKAQPKSSDGPPCIEGRGCQKSLAQQQPFAPLAPTKGVHGLGTADQTLLSAAIPTPLGSARPGTEMSVLHLAVPPPSDLVILLQRFLI
jgi:hypothetical protein